METRFNVAIYLFPCGHGDTILVRAGDNHWALIDCHLPVGDGTRDRFFNWVGDLGITRLDYVFQTHPDYDHYHGMIDVLKYFTRDGRSVGKYVDSGLTALYIDQVLRRQPRSRHYKELQDYLQELHEGKVLEWCELDARRPVLRLCGGQCSVCFVPIGPDPGQKRQILLRDCNKLATNPAARLEANRLSLIVVLECKANGHTFAALLASDSDEAGLSRALDLWEERARGRMPECGFGVVKVPHHGSIQSHSARLAGGLGAVQGRVAAISAGTRDALPDRAVIQAYQEAGWAVALTTTRGIGHVRAEARGDRPMTLADRGPRRMGQVLEHLVRIDWDANPGIRRPVPEGALVLAQHLDRYGSAG
jgi:beta-lactamase superfamily II metal-dependent hydrolase